MKRAIFVLAVLIFTAHVPFAGAAYEKETSLRGVDREESRFLDPFGDAFSVLTYVPRQALNGLLYGTGHTSAFLSDEDFIKRVKDILYFYDDKLMWYPILSYASGFRTAYGAGLRYKDENISVRTEALLHDSDYWSYSVKPSFSRYIGWGEWENSVLAVIEKKDDRRFYGLGPDPHNDHRNTFVGSNDYGVYTELRKKIQWSS